MEHKVQITIANKVRSQFEAQHTFKIFIILIISNDKLKNKI